MSNINNSSNIIISHFNIFKNENKTLRFLIVDDEPMNLVVLRF